MPLKPEQLEARLQEGLSPVYLIAGPEPLLVQECRDAVRAAAAAAGFEEREIVHVDASFDWSGLEDAAGAPSLFSQRKILDLRLPTGKPGREGAQALTTWAEKPDEDTLLLVSCEAWDSSSRKSKWARVMERAGTRVDIWPIKGDRLPGWIEARMRAAGLQPEREAVLMLADRLEGNLLAANQEIQKLVLLKGSGAVSAADVRVSVADSTRFDAFELVERLMAGALAEGLRVCAGLRRTDVPLQLVTGALFKEFRTLEALRTALLAGESESVAFRRLGIWRSRQGAMSAAARRVDSARLSRAVRILASIDRMSKGQQRGDPWHALDSLVCMMCQPRSA